MRLELTNNKLHLVPKRVVWEQWNRYRPFAVWIDNDVFRIRHTLDATVHPPTLLSVAAELFPYPGWKLVVSRNKPYRIKGSLYGALYKVFLKGWWIGFYYKHGWYRSQIRRFFKRLRGL